MNTLNTSTVEVDGARYRVFRKGQGRPLVFLAGFGGLPKWTPFLDFLAKDREVIAPSLPGFPGGGNEHLRLDCHLDWLVTMKLLLDSVIDDAADLAASSVGGALAADVAALWPEMVRKLALIAPLGIFNESEPTVDPWAQRKGDQAGVFCAEPDNFNRLCEPDANSDPVEWAIEQARANEAAARLLWPLGDTRLRRRLPLIQAETLLIWGKADRLIPVSYAQTVADLIPVRTETRIISGAGHLAELDQPSVVAEAILQWMN